MYFALEIMVNMMIVDHSIRLFLFATCLLILTAFDTIAGTGTLAWDANSETNIAGYRIHYGTVLKPYSKMVDVKTTTATLSSLLWGSTYTVAATAYNTAGVESAYSPPLTYTAGSKRVIAPAALVNISTRTLVQTGEDVMIGGFIVDGIVPKKVALRAIGPSLVAAGLTGAMSDPVLQLMDSSGAVVASNDSWNDNWRSDQEAAIIDSTVPPADDGEAAIVSTLAPGSYSAVIRGANGATGVALVEVYALNE
jgi:hypothetical protein